MATIQNDRDILLQAATTRVVPVPIDPSLIPGLTETIAATKGIKLSAPSNVFQISTGGVASPSSITVTATLTLVTSTVTWDIFAGTATLTGSGNSRTLTAANMVSNSVTIRARVQESGGPIYTDYWTIAKTADGLNGTNGSNGERGSITAFGTLSNLVAYPGRASGRARWAAGSATESNAITADTAASNVIWRQLGNSGSAPSNAHMRLGDTVTLTNSGQTVSATGYWTGAAWDTPGTVIDGNLLVGGNVSGQEFTGGTFTGATFRTATSGTRAELYSDGANAHSLIFYTGIDTQYSIRIAPGVTSSISGNLSDFMFTAANIAGGTNGGGLRGSSSSNGVGVRGQTGSGIGVQGRAASSGGIGGEFESPSGAAIRLVPVTTMPADKTAGNICYHVTNGFCVANGTSWFTPSSWTVVT